MNQTSGYDPIDGEVPVLLIDEPQPIVRRLTLNRPARRNALNDALRSALFEVLRAGDRDRTVSVMIARGGGSCFSAGYDRASANRGVERSIAKVDGWWSRHVVNNWFEMWDMATPIIAQVQGYCLTGASELATGCDLVYVARRHVDRLSAGSADVVARHAVADVVDGGLRQGWRRF